MENLILTETIDRYLAGVMSTEELQEFEKKLASDSSLKKEVDIQREIIKAIRKKALREKIQQFKRQKVQNIIRWTIYTLTPIAVAACVVGIVVVPQFENIDRISNNTELYASATNNMMEAYTSLKGSDEASNIILEATELINKEEYKEADKILIQGLELLNSATKENIQSWYAKEDMLYLRALCSIKGHKVYRSRYLLSEIIKMNGTHKTQAENLLKEIKGSK